MLKFQELVWSRFASISPASSDDCTIICQRISPATRESATPLSRIRPLLSTYCPTYYRRQTQRVSMYSLNARDVSICVTSSALTALPPTYSNNYCFMSFMLSPLVRLREAKGQAVDQSSAIRPSGVILNPLKGTLWTFMKQENCFISLSRNETRNDVTFTPQYARASLIVWILLLVSALHLIQFSVQGFILSFYAIISPQP